MKKCRPKIPSWLLYMSTIKKWTRHVVMLSNLLMILLKTSGMNQSRAELSFQQAKTITTTATRLMIMNSYL